MDIKKAMLLGALLMTFGGSALADDTNASRDGIRDRGDRVEHRLDRKGDRIDRRLDRRSERAAAAGRDGLARHLDRKGDRIDRRLDRKGDRIDRRLDRRHDRRH
ncbi:MAG: hypothetical protein OEW64_11670 [Gammaproteobacteria bacterium]|nr:hypothetical protein [Gammaproteobacteria bacterium]